MTDLEVIKEVNDWYSKNHHMFKTDEYYGIDIVCELYKLVNKCVSDGGELESIHKRGTMENRQNQKALGLCVTAEDDK